MSAVRGNAHRRADLLRLKSVIESVTQVRVAAGHSAWHRQIPHQRASCGMSGAYRVGGERAGVWPEMRTRRAGGGTFRRMYECVRVRKWEAPPPSRPRRMRTLRSLGGHAGCAAHARTGCRCAERCSAACVRVRVRLRALPGDLIPAEVEREVRLLTGLRQKYGGKCCLVQSPSWPTRDVGGDGEVVYFSGLAPQLSQAPSAVIRGAIRGR